jgi:signal transduction histidine kinase/HAMP domain-containing protein/ActR/RegA family two-component response regulator
MTTITDRAGQPADDRLQRLLTGLTAVRSGDFSTRLPAADDPLMDEIAAVFNGMNEQLALVTSEVTRVAREVGSEGRLGGQAEVPPLAGSWKDLTDSVNSMAGNLTGQVRDVARVAMAVAKGDLGQKITVDARGEILELKNTINTMVDELSAFADEVTRVAREVGTDGRLGGQARVPGIGGTWRDLTDSVNFMAGNLTAQVRSIAQVATAVAQGDLTQKITVDARGEILELKTTLNTMVDQLSAFADEVTRVAREVGTEGNLGGQAAVRGVSGTWEDLTNNVNVMASNLTAQVRSIAQVATAVARGDLSQKITVEARGEVAVLAEAINGMVDTLSVFGGEVTRVAREVGTEGILGGQAVVPHVAGTWKDLTDNVNSMANNLTSQVRNIAQVTTAVANGDLSKKIDVDARGEILELKTTINTMVDQLSSFAAEVTRVAREVGSEGRLGGQAEVEGVSGTWKRLTENVNELAGNLTRQVRAIAGVTSAVATGDLTRSISVEAQGEVAELKDNINAMVQSLRETTNAYEDQGWLQSNLARIAGRLQGHRDLRVVAELIMDDLVPMVGAQHGTFFLAESDGGETRLRLIAGYGLRADIEAPSQFRLGQSLIGQVARTKKPIVVTDLPADYVKISSGLGEAAPVNLMVLPIVFEDQVLGVIEAGSFSRFTQLHQDFMEQLMETIGVNVNTIIANSRTDALLAESQRLAAELQARTRELQVRQDELQRSNAELEDKAAQLARQNRDIEIKNVEIEQARQELEDRARELDLASRYKSQFLANMSHELRTPLNSLLILARLLSQNAEQNLTPKQVEYAQVIHSSGTDLLQLINDILDLSRVEAGRMDLHPERFALGALVDDLRAIFRPLTTEKGLEFVAEPLPRGLPAELVTDRQRLRQILHNLLSNAVKFTDQGRVELRITASTSPGAADPVIAFAVTDTGVGISEHNLEVIFGAFQQGDGTTSRRYGGTGLGLAICRELATQLGGQITAESVPGEGSTFTLFLPARLPASDEREPAAQPSGLVASNGAAGGGTGGTGGASAASAASGTSSVGGASGAAGAGRGGEERTKPAGSPPDPPAAQRNRRSATPPGAHNGLRGKRVLIVDDDMRNAFAITSILELYGMTVLHAPDGRTGIEMLRSNPGIDIVLMDVMMPEQDGYTTTGVIRKIPELRGLPVIAVTARAMHGDRDKSLAAGATDYITKPVDTEELLSCMERWMKVPGARET